MSSSRSEDDCFELDLAHGRRSRKRASTPRPGGVPRKKGKVIPVISDLAIDDSDNEHQTEEGMLATSRKVQGNAGPPQRRKAGALAVVNGDAGRGSLGSPGIPKEKKAPAPSRLIKHLSIRSNESSGGDVPSSFISSGIGGGGESDIGIAEMQTIYETCRQLFNANRINPQNAFSLRLLDCINQMINSPGYDKKDMRLTSSTVEIGTKIYICRVDNVHSQVLSLASDITLQQQQHRKRKRDGRAQEAELEVTPMSGDDADMEDGEDRRSRPRPKKRVIRKRGKFVEEDNSKLLTGMEGQNVKFATRRNCLTRKFNEMIVNDLDFDYQSYFLEPEDEHPLKTGAEEGNLKSQLGIPETYVNSNDMARLDFLPFNHLPKYDPETHDIWGIPLSSAEMERAEISHGSPAPMDRDDYVYDPAERPTEYEVEGDLGNLNDSLDEELSGFNTNAEGGGGLSAVSFQDIRSLDHLDNYFQRIRNLTNDKSKYGWCGPKFVLPKTWAPLPRGARARKAIPEPEKIDFSSIDWSANANKFSHSGTDSKGILDDEVVEAWCIQKAIIPFQGIELDYDRLHPEDIEYENGPSYVPAMFRFFLNSHRNILQLLGPSERLQQQGSAETSMGPPSLGEDGFDGDNAIEVLRESADVFGAQPMTEDEIQPQPDTAPQEAEWQFPGSLFELLNDDLLGAVSGMDSIRFCLKPKPIDMSALKRGILEILSEKLYLDEWGNPVKYEETTIGLAQLMYQVLQQIGPKTENIMSVAIFVVALMHVVADKKLFVLYDEATDPECPMVVCKGKGWVHADHIQVLEAEFGVE